METYTYQLVLQFAVSKLSDFDQISSFEERLLCHLIGLAKVDGHDFGIGELNIFILTDSPAKTFEISEDLRQRELPDYVPVAAYRELLGEEYVVLSPLGQTGFNVS